MQGEIRRSELPRNAWSKPKARASTAGATFAFTTDYRWARLAFIMSRADHATMRGQVTVFGGTGFLGQRVVRHLLDDGCSVRIASRRPDRAQKLFAGSLQRVEPIRADVRDEASITAAVSDVEAVVNAVSLYVERGADTFHSVHVEAARRVALLAHKAGINRLVHISGIGADPDAKSPYIRSRGEGERAVRAAFSSAIVIRPAIMFGPHDSLVTLLAKLLKRLPLFPLFGKGQTKLQPVYVEDVAEAITRCLKGDAQSNVFELGGPKVHSYEGLLRLIAEHIGKRPVFLPIPFPLWHAVATLAEFLPTPPVTRNQIELMGCDTVVSPGMPGLNLLRIRPTPIEDVLEDILA